MSLEPTLSISKVKMIIEATTVILLGRMNEGLPW